MTRTQKTTKRMVLWMRPAMAGVMLLTGLGLGACVRVEAPDKPIEINLNINIRQEVVYRLDGDAKELIEEKSGIF